MFTSPDRRIPDDWTVPGAAPDAGATFYLARLYQRMAELPAGDTPELRAGRAAVYDTIVATIREARPGSSRSTPTPSAAT